MHAYEKNPDYGHKKPHLFYASEIKLWICWERCSNLIGVSTNKVLAYKRYVEAWKQEYIQ